MGHCSTKSKIGNGLNTLFDSEIMTYEYIMGRKKSNGQSWNLCLALDLDLNLEGYFSLVNFSKSSDFDLIKKKKNQQKGQNFLFPSMSKS